MPKKEAVDVSGQFTGLMTVNDQTSWRKNQSNFAAAQPAVWGKKILTNPIRPLGSPFKDLEFSHKTRALFGNVLRRILGFFFARRWLRRVQRVLCLVLPILFVRFTILYLLYLLCWTHLIMVSFHWNTFKFPPKKSTAALWIALRQTMDATSMTFEDDRFDLAVDKGTLDAMMSAGDQEHTLAGAP